MSFEATGVRPERRGGRASSSMAEEADAEVGRLAREMQRGTR